MSLFVSTDISSTNPFPDPSAPEPSVFDAPASLPPHVEHRQRVIGFKVALVAAAIFGTSLLSIGLMTLAIYYPSLVPLNFVFLGSVSVVSFTAFAIASVKFVRSWLHQY